MTSSVPASQRFVDYFVVCGLDLSSGLEPDRLSGDNLHCTPLERPYKSKVLAHFPDNVPWNPFDGDAVGMLCLPKGLQFRTQKLSLDPWFHSFIITKKDGSRTHGFAYTFYEEVTSKQICVAMQTLQAMHLAELSNTQSRTLHLHDPHGTRSLPRSFKLSSHHSPADSCSFYEILKDKLYVTKCVCLITQLPFLHACRKFLVGLYNTISSTEPPRLHIESYIHNILYEVTAPPTGCSALFTCFDEQVLYQRPGADELPLFEYSLQEFFRILGVENVLQLFTSVLLENQVLLYSRDYHKLMLVAESITMLLFPFTWQHVYVPILPASMWHFLDAPVPYIMGLHNGSGDKSSPPQVPGEANLCYVDIDNQCVELPEDLPQFPHKQEFLQELSEYLNKHNVPAYNCRAICDRNLNDKGLHPPMKYRRRKMSWGYGGYDSDSGMGSTDGSICSSNGCHTHLPSNQREILQRSEALQRITAIAKRTGVISSFDDFGKPCKFDREGNLNPNVKDIENHLYLEELKFNNAIREIFLNRFTYLFSAYEHFVIQLSQDMDQWMSSRETMQNFDKATFLSDQPEPHLPFLSRFIETQTFVTLIDNKIVSQWEEQDPYLKIFDTRIKVLRDRYGDSLVRTPSYESCTTIRDTEILIEKRLAQQEFIASCPQSLDIPNDPRLIHRPKFFPPLDATSLNKEPVINKIKKRSAVNHHGRRKERCQSLQLENHFIRSDHKEGDDLAEKYFQESRSKRPKQPVFAEMSAAVIAKTNWNFVEQLLRECKTKTKRMLVEKMGQEAVELGHGEISITGVEENTLIASLCDLLERIWSHGLQTKQGKSALWSHLLSYQKIEECNDRNKPVDPNFLAPVFSPPCSVVGIPELLLMSIKTGTFSSIAAHLTNFDLSAMAPEFDASLRRSRENKDLKKKAKTPDIPGLKALPMSLTFDMRNVQSMREIKTEIGYARAWVRLSLEKKLLSKHLKTLLSNVDTLRNLYKRYAFLRCDDEKEQFLYHLLSLNAVDYFCFTNTFTNTIVPYKIVIFPSRKFSASTTSANAWVCVSGNLGETGMISVPKVSLELSFQHKNLGILTTLRIGHDNTGISPKWMIEHVLVRNEITGHTFKFPCGRWLGKGIDDGSTERLLVGELVPSSTDNDELMETCRTPPRCRSPNLPRKTTEARQSMPEIQQMLADAVNNIIKHYYKPEKERGSLTILLCGEMGLVYCLEQVFLYGFKSTRLFGRHLYIWDFFVKVQLYFTTLMHDDEDAQTLGKELAEIAQEHLHVMRFYCKLVNKINLSSHTVGKDGKFQLFVCLATRDQILHKIMSPIASSPVTAQMYEDQSFLRDPNLVTFLIQILESLSEFPFNLEASLTKGIDRHK